MSSEQLTYENYILNTLLNLRKGDSLSVNTEERDFDFARRLALNACRITSVPVKIVITCRGKVSDVTEIEPEGQFAQAAGSVFLRIQDSSVSEEKRDINITSEKDNLPLFQRYGHLAEPLFADRRVSVPWCVVPAVADAELTGMMTRDMPAVADTLKRGLNALNIESFSFKGEKTDFSVSFPEETEFSGGSHFLPSGRAFCNSVYTDRLYRIVDCHSAKGVLSGKLSLFGKTGYVTLFFENGHVVPDGADEMLKSFLKLDELIGKPGYISVRNNEFRIFFGGAVPDGVSAGLLEKKPLFLNNSIYSFSVTVDSQSDLFCFSDGKRLKIATGGVIDKNIAM